jgi:hypothetical protein
MSYLFTISVSFRTTIVATYEAHLQTDSYSISLYDSLVQAFYAYLPSEQATHKSTQCSTEPTAVQATQWCSFCTAF